MFFDPDVVPEPPFNGGLLGFLQPLLVASLHLGVVLPTIHPVVEELQAGVLHWNDHRLMVDSNLWKGVEHTHIYI